MSAEARPLLAGRYRWVSTLSNAPESSVLLVEDTQRNDRRSALKVLRVASGEALEIAQREFEVLRKLQHRGIAEVFDFGRFRAQDLTVLAKSLPQNGAAELAYIGSVYYDGLNLREAFLRLFPEVSFNPGDDPGASAEGLPQPATAEGRWRVFLEALAQICEALAAVHKRGLIHYDIKPENLVLVPHGRDERALEPGSLEVIQRLDAKILDFGLTEEETTPLGTRARGTIPFIAPELLDSRRSDHRADLFSLGVAIAYAVTGRFPFPGARPERWLAAAREGQIVDLRKLRPDMPKALADLTESLLNPRPSRRPQSALEVLSLLEKTGGFKLPMVEQLRRRTLPSVGWEREIGRVRREIENLKRGEAEKTLIILQGDAGQFLDQVLDEVEILARIEGVLTRSGTAFWPRRYPFQPFAEVAHKLSQDFDFSSPSFQRYATTLSAFAPMDLPAEALRKSALPPLKPKAEACRFLDLATELFLEASRDAPLVITIRGLEEAGKESLELLRSLARCAHQNQKQHRRDGASDSEPPRLLIVATYRQGSGESESVPGARGIAESLVELGVEPFTEVIQLGALGLHRIPEWIKERAPELQLEGELIRRLHEKTGGSPWLIEEFILRATGRAGESSAASTRAAETVDPQILLRLPRNPGEATNERARSLGPSQRRALQILAVARGPLQLREIATVEETILEELGDDESLSVRVEALRDLGLVSIRETAMGLEAAISHPELAEQVYRQTGEDQRTAIHRALALALLEKTGSGGPGRCPEDIAFHARMAGLNGLYFRQAILAADTLCSAQACDAAAQLYEELLERLGTELSADAETPTSALEPELLRARIHEQLATIHISRGQFQKAIERLTFLSDTQERSSNPERRASIYRTLGEVYQQMGEPTSAAYFMEKSLKLLAPLVQSRGHETAKSDGRSATALKEHLLTQLAMARYHAARDSLDDAARSLKAVQGLATPPESHREVCCRAQLLEGEVAARRGDHVLALTASVNALTLAEAERSLPLVLEVLPGIGRSYQALGDHDRALENFERGLELARRLESKIDAAAYLSHIGTLHHNRADHERALDCFTRSLWLFSQVGDLKGIANIYNNLGIVYSLKDDLQRASNSYKMAIDLFSRLNDQQGIAASMNNLSSCLEHEGKYNEALDYSFRALEKRKKARSHSGMAFSYYRIGKIYQAKGELEKALTYAEKSLQIRAEIGERLGIAYTRLLIAECDASQGRYAESFQLSETALKDFQSLENEVGALLAREMLARVHYRVGDLQGAQKLLEDAMVESGKLGQTILTGHCLLSLSRIEFHAGESAKARGLVSRAEKIYRSLQNQREIAEVLLDTCALCLREESWDAASDALEKSYSILETLGIRDLVPHYFLQRGRLVAATSAGAEAEAARKLFERGLVESRELNLLDLQWQLHVEKGKMDARLGDPKLARIHFLEAKKVLDDIYSSLPEHLQAFFFSLPGRSEPDKLLEQDSSGRHQEPGRKKLSDTDSHKAAALAAPREPSPLTIADALQLHRETLRLHQIAAAVGSEPDLPKLLESVLDAVIELVKAERGFIILRHWGGRRQGGGQSISVARNLDKEEILDPQGKMSKSILRKVLKTGKPILLGNVLREPHFKKLDSIRKIKLLSLVCVPLRFRSEVLGLIYLDNRHLRDAFRPDDLSILQAFADQAAVAVVNARLIEENMRRTNELMDANRRMETMNAHLESTVKERTKQLALVKEDLRNRQDQLEARYRFHNVVGKSDAMQRVFSLLEKVMPTHIPVLLEGESGTGKELMARALHFNGPRRGGRFVSLDCGALHESLLESELFGHVRGAFTGAVSDKKGLFEIADNGTLFLGKVSDMSLGMQQKLLRVLQEGGIRRVGGKEDIQVNVRIISASNKKLSDLVAQERFRQDLYYRINGVRIQIPSLRERREDIPALVSHFLELAQKPIGTRRQFAPGAVRALMGRDWPGNIRELRHFVERTLIMTTGQAVKESDLFFDESPALVDRKVSTLEASPGTNGQLVNPRGSDVRESGTEAAEASLRVARNDFEREFLLRCLRASEGNVALAARRSKVSRESFYRLLRKYGLTPRGPAS